MDDEPEPGYVWVLIMWEGSPLPATNDPQDWPSRGALMGVYATRRAALDELEAECGPEERAHMRWVQPGRDPDEQQLRHADPAEGWFELRREPVRMESHFHADRPDGGR